MLVPWQETGLWNELKRLKPVTCEPRGSKEEFERTMDDYYTGIQFGRGGIFLAVCRGKVRRQRQGYAASLCGGGSDDLRGAAPDAALAAPGLGRAGFC